MPDIFKKIVQEVSRNETFEQLLRRIGFGQEFIDPYVNGQPIEQYVETVVTESPVISNAIIIKSACIVSFDRATAVATGDGTFAFTVPAQLDGMNLVDVVCSVNDKGVTGATDIQIRRRRAGSNADMLTTKITIGDEFFATDEGVNASNDDVATGDQIYVDVDAVHSGTAPNGLSTVLTFQEP